MFIFTIDNGESLNQRCENVNDLTVDIAGETNGLQFKIEGLTKETAVILFEIYKRNNEWKIQAVGDGFNAGLDAILKQYSGDNLK